MNITDLIDEINTQCAAALMCSAAQTKLVRSAEETLMRSAAQTKLVCSAEQTKSILELSALHRLQAAYAPGTFLGDLSIVKNKNGNERRQALLRLGSKIFFQPKKPAARRALVSLARNFKTTPKKLLSEWLIPAGLIFALDNRKNPQTFRPGKAWIKGLDNKIAKIPPESLGATEFDRWIVWQSRHNTEKSLVDDVFDEIKEQSFDQIKKRFFDKVDYFVTDMEEKERSQAETAHQIVLLLKKQATPQQRELLKLISRGWKDSEIATKMQVTPSTVRVTKHHLKVRAKALQKKLLKNS